MTDEMILVVRRALFDELGAFQGLNFEIDRYLPALLARENNFFTARPAAETDPSLKQIIPYVLLVHEGRVLHYVRGKKAGEQRREVPLDFKIQPLECAKLIEERAAHDQDHFVSHGANGTRGKHVWQCPTRFAPPIPWDIFLSEDV